MVNTSKNKMIDYDASVRDFEERKVILHPRRLHFCLPDAKGILEDGLKHFLDNKYQWQPEYDEVADWLSDNKGLGLFCMGNCGRGKTTICLQVLPCIMHHYFQKIFSTCLAREMNRQYDDVMNKALLIIDDIGREEPYQEYGNHFNVFPDFVDDCERKGKLLITNTNCTKEQLAEKYGERTLSRLKGTTRLVAFSGEDLRHG